MESVQIRERQLLYGFLWGFVAFGAGWLITSVTIPQEFLSTRGQRWQVVSWVYLSANFVKISGSQVAGLGNFFSEFDVISQTPELNHLRAVPLLVLAFGSVLASNSIGYSGRLRHQVLNCGHAAIGYVFAGIATMVFSGARPGVSVVLLLFIGFGGALLVGSIVMEAIPTTMLGITSIWGVMLIGLVVLAGGLVVFETVLPLILVAVAYSQIGAVLLWMSRELPK